MAKEGSTIGGLMDSFGTAISMSLQYGVPLEVLVNKFSHTRFEPMGYTTNPDIRIAKSLVDYIFRWLGLAFIPGFREATLGLPGTGSKPDPIAQAPAELLTSGPAASAITDHPPVVNGHSTNGHLAESQASADLLDRAGVRMKSGSDGEAANRNDQFARFQSDAPSCDNCGAITVRNGNCYLCHNCGNSMGCS
jgi:ribonucleoside-diphosphate reductase alpha chain